MLKNLGLSILVLISLGISSSASAVQIQNLANFNGTNGSNPVSSLTAGSGGLFYGTTARGGPTDLGTIFSFNPVGNVLTSLASFKGTNGSQPIPSLTAGSGGLFYGTTPFGGTTDLGTIFSFNPVGNVLTSLASFNGANGANPFASLTAGSGGLFYGTTRGDEITDADGTIFSFNPVNNVLTSLVSFNGANGSNPFASLTAGSGGLFYGATVSGTTGDGTIFSFNPVGNILTSLASFNGTNGASPFTSLTAGSGGLFYGTTDRGGITDNGTIFSFNPVGTILTSLVSFNGTNGSGPFASLTAGSGGLFYGTTDRGGITDNGTIFSFNPVGTILTSLDSFNGANGSNPLASLTAGSGGLFYGTTTEGRTAGSGTIYSFDVGTGSGVTVPEAQPLSILGVMTVLGLGGALKRRLK